MPISLAELAALLARATCPADVFGPLAGDQGEALRRRYRELATAAHPDRNPGAAAVAHEAFTALGRWHEQALRQVAQGCYGRAPLIDLTVRGRRYVGYAGPLRGDLCDLFPVEAGDGPLLLKVARHPARNNLLAAESRALALLDQALAGDPLRAHFPALRDSFMLADASGARRQVNALRHEAGTLTLAEVLRRRPRGLDAADAAWIFNRVLAALGAAHGAGLVHGALLPEHVLVRPADHNGILIDWCYSVPAGTPLRAFSPPRAADYPPEVMASLPATPATDIFMAARCMARLLGGEGDAATLPATVPAAIRALLAACMIDSPHRRPADAWQVFDDFQAILRERYGPPVFRPFPILA